MIMLGPKNELEMPEKKYHKRDIARFQLETAVVLFLNKRDLSSVITLAGAAANILDRLVRNEGKEAFVDYARRVHRDTIGFMPKRQSYSHHIDKSIGAIVHKHMGKDEPEEVDLDLDKMAHDALTRALADYIKLNGQDDPFVKAFLSWSWKNMNGNELMEKYMKAPERLKPQ